MTADDPGKYDVNHDYLPRPSGLVLGPIVRELSRPSGAVQRAVTVYVTGMLGATYTEQGVRQWLGEGNERLGGLTPVEAIARGRLDDVIGAAESIGGLAW